MTHQPQIILQQLSYAITSNKPLLENLSLAFRREKTAIIGRNGIGKSTLLKLIVGELKPSSGKTNLSGTIFYCPQDFALHLDSIVIEILGAAEKISALDRIELGSMDLHDFEIVGDDWNIKSRTIEHLKKFGLADIELTRSLRSLSGGEITRLWLAKAFFEKVDFIIFDEPTNNLDLKSKQLLCAAIQKWDKGLIVVSHDRNLLELMDKIVELTSKGAHVYGGNYQHYLEQKSLEEVALSRQLNDAKKHMSKTKESIQKSREKHAQREAKGNSIRRSGSQSKLILDSMKERSGKTSRKLSIKEDLLLKTAEQQLKSAKEKLEITNQIKINLPKTSVPSQKIIAKLEGVSFKYETQSHPIIHHLNLLISGPERIALVGDNGSGKTTLVKLIQGILKPCNGKINMGTSRISYLDQNASLLNPDLSILENFKKINPDIDETAARFSLADFLFRNTDALKIVSRLSGGEKLRAALACILTSNVPPQLLILDEPTNHLDLSGIAAIESALVCYQGSLIVISHDKIFLENINLSRYIQLSK